MELKEEKKLGHKHTNATTNYLTPASCACVHGVTILSAYCFNSKAQA